MFKLLLILRLRTAFMNFCATILLKILIQIWMNSLLLFKLPYLHFIVPQQYRPLYPKQQIVILASFRIFQCILLKSFLECAIPIQLNTSRQGLNPRPEDNLGPRIHCLSEPLPLLLQEAEPPGEDCSQLKQ